MKRRHPLIPLVIWLGVAVTALLLALAFVISQRDVADVQLDRAHMAGMELGQQMCLGFRSEMQRAPARQGRGGLL